MHSFQMKIQFQEHRFETFRAATMEMMKQRREIMIYNIIDMIELRAGCILTVKIVAMCGDSECEDRTKMTKRIGTKLQISWFVAVWQYIYMLYNVV
mmetsp:Transcript_15889/g.18801  ORF Transcript_15889/g.18801 Transcript_15889/m.18801 type:complete len:96 (-) Transcript_15889:59-346(-)